MANTRVAIVTGGSRGIGAAVAKRLASQDVTVAVNYLSSLEAATDTVDVIREGGGTAVAILADVADPQQVAALFDETESQFGGVDIVVAAAGIVRSVLMAQATEDDYTNQVEVNIRGTFNVLREAASRVRDGGRIVTFSSTTLALNAPGYGIYNATKAAAEGFTRVLAKELGGRAITVNSIAPGPVETNLFMAGKSAADVSRLAGLSPQHRIGQPSDIANAVSLIVSSDANWINGQVIRVNGGMA